MTTGILTVSDFGNFLDSHNNFSLTKFVDAFNSKQENQNSNKPDSATGVYGEYYTCQYNQNLKNIACITATIVVYMLLIALLIYYMYGKINRGNLSTYRRGHV